ncbi:MAG TPA: cardiolipin synthase [Smithellaceae bacterium]|nr:cardiolipin synthase [Smithellaceae bacterium]
MVLGIAGIIEVLSVSEKNRSLTHIVPWLILILLLPVFGYILYLLWGRSGTHSRKSKKIYDILSSGPRWRKQSPGVGASLAEQYPIKKRTAAYLQKEGFPIYANTDCTYFPLGELQFDALLSDLEKAERYIFMEFFIVSQGQLWDRVHEILKLKAAQGVEVRFLYDDLGSIFTLPKDFVKSLSADRISAQRFNPAHKYLSRLYLNFRNHQKIVVIDGRIGYTGGTNLADEYANLYEKHGHWKDAAIRLTGEAVWGLTVTFLQMWEAETELPEDYERYHPRTDVAGHGFYQPFDDGPVNHEHNPAEAVYRQTIHSAQSYVWITTPYLVIDEIMIDALSTAAVGGVDVRIVTPKIWDHWYVHMVTRSNYGRLLESGVRIYEYTPGYIHAKTILSDDIHAVTGSINMDYRSFYLHFENGVSIYGAPVLQEIKSDMLAIFMVSEEISLEQWERRPYRVKILQSFLRLFIPLL